MTHRYMLDTNTISNLLRNQNDRLTDKVRQQSKTVCTSILVAAELRYGVDKKGSSRLRAIIEELLAIIDILPFESPADTHYARIRTELEATGKPIGPNDLLIAAHACATGTVLVTDNVKEFSRVPGLQIENWL
ncbi:tRNA(fMet)-specific endonuclease VapC [Phyllobacterium myrsinacearum]|uniref:type II toxin-antitoxin system VapC family toxin n=1 Tax=Phyllobacterium myrsinacearum TaxID=28101 RepID=UPI00102A3DCC|nr:type II toxin-antitoxin system VapC family toxin [Phyllobacterium myrsinacearum]RZS88437.1 tRNA(fMet)-specific endonuclease VapC [Phyllobacterium myrsinacearum]